MLEELVVKHCAPTLAGIKTGNLFTCKYNCKNKIKNKIIEMNKILLKKDICILPLKFMNDTVLIYIYRRNKLTTDFFNNDVTNILYDRGYTPKSPSRCIVTLIRKLNKTNDFPHEIGLFLGYPPQDVEGFIRDSSCFKCIGYWKVYHNECETRKLFYKYTKCSCNYYKLWIKGLTIEQLAV